MLFDSISSNIDEVVSINPSANVSVFGDFNIIRTGLPILVELIDLVKSYNFSVSNDLTQVDNYPTWIPDFDSHTPAILNLFISSDTSICSTMAFLHWKILIVLLFQFPLTFHHIKNRMPHFITLLMTFTCWLGWSSWSFERCSVGAYL